MVFYFLKIKRRIILHLEVFLLLYAVLDTFFTSFSSLFQYIYYPHIGTPLIIIGSLKKGKAI